MNKNYFQYLVTSWLFILTTISTISAQNILSGRVYEGDVGIEPPNSSALSGVTVTLYGSNNSNELGTQIGKTTTDNNGWYGLEAVIGFEFYTIAETDPSGYYSVGATSVDGTVLNNNRIRYSTASKPIADQTLTGNKFWDKPDQPANNSPVADANGPYTGTVGNPITLDGSGSYDPDAGDTITSYEWDIDNDGQYDDANGVSPTWTWYSSTTTVIKLKVTDTHGAWSSDSTLVTINPQSCKAAFNADPRQGCAPLTVNFTDQSGNAQSWEWIFPGGTPNTSNQQNPTVTYQNHGTYSVQMKIRCQSGYVDSTIQVNYITVNQCASEMDYGDAPEPSYPTLLASDGARHIIDPDVFLGNSIDADPDGQPTSLADGDDIDGNDDEDGVLITSSFITGSSDTIQVTASTEGFLNAWIDYNANGSWAEADEHVFIDQTLNAGLNYLILNVPSDAVTGTTFARFRFSRSQALGYAGEAPDGEVEDYQVEIDQGSQLGSITIIKAANPPDSSMIFNFTGDLGNFTLSPASNKKAFSNLSPGNYNISETLPGSWFLGNYQISGDLDGGTTHDSLTATWTIDLDADENIFIVIYNYKGGTITIEKQTLPDGSQQLFNFTGDLGAMALADDYSGTQYNLQPGQYKVTETVPTNWVLADISCSDLNSTADLPSATATINLEAGETVKVIFTNVQEGADVLDYGDAPDPTFPTLLASNGARHIIDPDVFLGKGVEADPDGQPDAGAQGDDNDGDDDEDGVVISAPIVPGSIGTAQITASTDGYLSGWIDFDQDGTWDMANDYIFSSFAATAGTRDYYFNIPANAVPGATFARFRFTNIDSDLVYTDGLIGNGEVEDYQVEIAEGGERASVGDFVWNDLDHDGIQDPGEPGLDSVQVSLFDQNGNLLAMTLTNFSGYYLFSNIIPDSYFIRFNLRPGYIYSPADQGTDDTIDSDAQPVLGDTPLFTLNAGDHISYMDAGMYLGDGEGEMDYGDAPDPSYPTLLASNGARHNIRPGYHLGAAIDGDPDGHPSAISDGDDLNPLIGPDDEDGVTMSPFIAPGQSVPITIVASDTGVINAWLDFNINGSWADAGEHFIVAQPVIPGANYFTLNVPVGAINGLSYARFRFSSIRQLSYDGLAPDGEVEDYAIEIKEPEDGSVTIVKDATPKDNTQFFICQQLSSGFFHLLCTNLQDPLNNKLTILNPSNIISITEAVIPGWLLQDIIISGDMDNGSLVTLASGRVDLDFDPGENIVITFKNIKLGDDELFDLGDAPDGTNHSGLPMNAYPGVPASFPSVFDPATGLPTGPRHAFPKTDAWLGPDVSGELDADLMPDVDGLTNLDPPNDAPDRDNFDDGVITPFPLPACRDTFFTYTITIPPGSSTHDRYVNVWFDWNRDGDWQDTFTCEIQNDAPEWAVQNQLIPGGFPPGTYVFATPLFKPYHSAETEKKPLWMRISIAEIPVTSDCGGCGPMNGYLYGETEDYYFIPGDQPTDRPVDFGDAPDPSYPTLLANNGARHTISPTLFLGSGIDPDNDGQPAGMADGDDKNIFFPGIPFPSGDEDGVQIPPVITAGATIPVTVIASAPGVLNAWLDFNINGSWADAGEHIIAAQPVVAGPNTFNINVPAAAKTGQSFARFRLSSVRDIGFDGLAPDGEVEDYPVSIYGDEGGDRGGITIIKDANPKDNTPFWLTVVYGIMGGAAPYRDPASNTTHIPNAPTGTYNMGEYVPAGWKLSDIVVTGDMDNGSAIDVSNSKVDIDLDTGEDITVIFKNNKTGDDYLYDFGDAPDNPDSPEYPTLHANGGAYHDIMDGFHLGGLIDSEPDGQPTPDALGDDNLNMDDEDGVIFSTPFIPGQMAVIEVVASAQGILNAWIDFDANKNWSDPGEHVIVNVPVISGNNTMTVNVPATAVLGPTFARFRFNRIAGISFTGYGHAGEVEDYEIHINEGGGEGPPWKWRQIPLKNKDPEMPYTPYYWGWDAKSVYDGTFIADDWFCKTAHPVTEIHWWGSYADWDTTIVPPNAPHAFHIGIWKDVPAGEDEDWSHPGEMIREWIVPRGASNEHIVGDDFHPEYMAKPDTAFKYEFYIPEPDWFHQEKDSTIYWLSIAAIYEEIPEEHVWGWLTREHFYNDDAVYIYEPVQPTTGVVAVKTEPMEEGWDMAFVLVTDEYIMDYDFGDAPFERYPTYLGQNGPLHIIDPNVYLGQKIDSEITGQPDHTATGDDNDGIDDDDGIVFISPANPDSFPMIHVTASCKGYLNAWVDFNNNGSWADSDEHIFKDIFIPAGLSSHEIHFPDDITQSQLFSRFRFCTVPGLTFVGIAIDGEVEDYYVNLVDTEIKDSETKKVPKSFGLYQNYPNPFNPNTTIKFDLPLYADISIKIYNSNGQWVRTLISSPYQAGSHNIIWDAKDNNGLKVTSGLYFVVLRAGNKVAKIKLLLVK